MYHLNHQPFMLKDAKWNSRSSIAPKSTSTCRMNFSAIRIASRYAPLLTCLSMSDIQAALDSSNAERTLELLVGGLSEQKLKRLRTSICDKPAAPCEPVCLSMTPEFLAVLLRHRQVLRDLHRQKRNSLVSETRL